MPLYNSIVSHKSGHMATFSYYNPCEFNLCNQAIPSKTIAGINFPLFLQANSKQKLTRQQAHLKSL